MNLIDEMLPELSDSKIIVYGADVTCLAFMYEAERAGLEVSYIVDGNNEKGGGIYLERRYVAPMIYCMKSKTILKS